jgi:hypothetical protein
MEAGQNTSIAVLDRLKAMHDGLHAWDINFLQRPKQRLRNVQRELEILMRGPLNPNDNQRKKELAQLIENLLEQEEIKWCQRSRTNWIQNGDRHTNFFHNYATARKKKNFIKRINNATGDFLEGTDNIKPLVLDYFTNLFASGNNVIDPNFLEKISPRITSEMNSKLLAPFTAEEVKKEVFSIGDLKAPGPDGCMPFFYKRFWHLVGHDITQAVLKSINDKVIPDGWNETMIVLIPKIDSPEEVV